MHVTLNLDENLAIELMKITGAKTKTEAIIKAMAGLIRRSPSIKDKKVKKQAPQYHDLDALAGSWTKKEATAFDKALAKQRTIDQMQSKRNWCRLGRGLS